MDKKINNEICRKWLEVDAFAKVSCSNSCEWYHGSWCLLKCLGMVVSVFSEKSFYKR